MGNIGPEVSDLKVGFPQTTEDKIRWFFLVLEDSEELLLAFRDVVDENATQEQKSRLVEILRIEADDLDMFFMEPSFARECWTGKPEV